VRLCDILLLHLASIYVQEHIDVLNALHIELNSCGLFTQLFDTHISYQGNFFPNLSKT